MLNCGHRWNIKTGATRSGKTFIDLLVVIPKRILACRGEGLIVLLGNTRGTLMRNILDPMREMWGPDLIGEIRGDNTVLLFGKKCYALGADNKKHVSRIQGAAFEYCYGDEVTTWSAEVFAMLKSRLSCPHSHFDGTCNPDNPNHWFKKFLESDADIYQQAYTIDENPFLTADFVENLKKEYTGTVYYNRFILGQWILADGLVYSLFSREKHVVESTGREYSAYYISMDFGTLNPTAMILWGKCGPTWYAVREYYHSGRETKREKTVEEYYGELENLAGDRYIKGIVIDPSASPMIVTIKKHGKYAVIEADNAVLPGIQNTAAELQNDGIKICDCCENTIREFGAYTWDEKAAERGEDKPNKVDDHAMDAIRYFVQTILRKQKAKVLDRRKLGIY